MLSSALGSPGSQRHWLGQCDPIPAGVFPFPLALPSTRVGDYSPKPVLRKPASQGRFLPFYIVEKISKEE